MTTELGQAVYDPQRQTFLGESMLGITPKDYSEETAREIDVAVKPQRLVTPSSSSIWPPRAPRCR